ncbi:hypothetical protein SAMN05428939_0092 [Streptomyces sp. TLI_105]|nr:hypothetical protein SAMN05428939_0092 [Streptomyces sp. TLI_105]
MGRSTAAPPGPKDGRSHAGGSPACGSAADRAAELRTLTNGAVHEQAPPPPRAAGRRLPPAGAQPAAPGAADGRTAPRLGRARTHHRLPSAPLRRLPAAKRVCGPVFAGSSDLGGADADFVTGGLLIDCKATTRPHQIGTAQVQQLAGYLSRQGGLITGPSWDSSVPWVHGRICRRCARPCGSTCSRRVSPLVERLGHHPCGCGRHRSQTMPSAVLRLNLALLLLPQEGPWATARDGRSSDRPVSEGDPVRPTRSCVREVERAGVSGARDCLGSPPQSRFAGFKVSSPAYLWIRLAGSAPARFSMPRTAPQPFRPCWDPPGCHCSRSVRGSGRAG